jgi:carbonic anhydrase/acetyltransferase-like protein (isoleucine patch superfamily)
VPSGCEGYLSEKVGLSVKRMFENNHNPLAWIRGLQKGHVILGEGCWVGPFAVIDGEHDRVTIGKGVDVSSGAQILTHDTVKRCITGRAYDQIDHAPVQIGNYVYIGTNAVILQGCVIGDHCVIAAGAVIKAHTVVPAYSLVAGVPAQIKKSVEQEVLRYRK